MSLLPYKSTNWNTHNEVKLRVMSFPLFMGEPTHFVLTRTYQGPRETFVPMERDTVDAIYNGVAAGITGTAATDEVVFASSKKFLTGDVVLLAVTSGLTGLTDATNYYLIRISDTAFKLATSRANAIAGTAINITADGTGTLTPPAAYLVDHSELSDADADQVKYVRTFSNVPASWSDREDFGYSFPAMPATTPGTGYAITAITVSGSNLVLASATATGIAANDIVFLNVAYTRNGFPVTQAVQAKVVSVSAGVSVTVPSVFPGSGAFSSVSGTVRKVTPGRAEARVIVGGSRLFHEYALTSESALDSALPSLLPFSIITSTGVETDTLSTTTTPTAATYQALIPTGGEIQVECTRRQYLGNIYRRTTRFVPAR